jgi:hypothetical protein
MLTPFAVYLREYWSGEAVHHALDVLLQVPQVVKVGAVGGRDEHDEAAW